MVAHVKKKRISYHQNQRSLSLVETQEEKERKKEKMINMIVSWYETFEHSKNMLGGHISAIWDGV